MRLASVSCATVCIATALSVAALPGLAYAQRGGAKPVAAPPAPLKVWIEGRSNSFDPAKLKATLETELKRRVELTNDASAAAVKIRLEGETRADVRYTTPSGEELSRGVTLPPDRERSAEVVSWLTVNLVRDEAQELLEELRARRKEEADARAAEAAAAEKAAADQAAADVAAAKAAADKAAADKAAADKAAADKAAADQAAAAAARKRAEQAKIDLSKAGGPQKRDENAGLLRDPLKSFDAAFVTPLSILPDSPKRLLHFQAALLYGESGGLQGVAVSSLALRTRHSVEGIVAAPGVTLVGGNLRGVVATAGYAQVDGVLEGVVSGAAAAVHRGKLGRGVVVAAGGAIAGELTGVVAAAGFASAKSLKGVAAAAGATVTRGPSEGVLAAGGVNFSEAHRGVEVAGGFNTARELDGLAIAPVNFHRKVKGLQLGVVNVAEEVHGAAIGVLSVAKSGKLQPVLWGANDGSLHVAVKSTVGFAFTQLGAGVDLGADTFSYDAGAGVHLELSQNVFLEPGVHYSSFQSTKDAAGAPDEHRLYYLAHLGYRVGDKIDLLVGAGARHTVAGGDGRKVSPELRAGIGFF